MRNSESRVLGERHHCCIASEASDKMNNGAASSTAVIGLSNVASTSTVTSSEVVRLTSLINHIDVKIAIKSLKTENAIEK